MFKLMLSLMSKHAIDSISYYHYLGCGSYGVWLITIIDNVDSFMRAKV